MLRELVLKNRSYRRFAQDPISRETLVALVDLARCSGSGANLQPLKYILSCDAETNARIFECTAWAGYLKDWPGPREGERPTGYVVMLCDTEISKNPGCDHGIAAQSILLGATELGLGGCMLGALQRESLRETLAIDTRYEISLVIALGKPIETVVLEDATGGNIKYYRESDGTHHVPKRTLDEIVLP
jgi:nitroreductase